MKVAKVTIALVAAIVCSADVNAALSVVQRGSGFRIDRNGKPLVNAVVIENGKKGEVGKDEVKTSFCKSARFGKVWNRWLEKSDGRYRLEVAERPDGAVEITFAGEVDPYDVNRARLIKLALSADALDGKEWDGLAGDGRRWNPVKGVFSADREVRDSHGCRPCGDSCLGKPQPESAQC